MINILLYKTDSTTPKCITLGELVYEKLYDVIASLKTKYVDLLHVMDSSESVTIAGVNNARIAATVGIYRAQRDNESVHAFGYIPVLPHAFNITKKSYGLLVLTLAL